MEMFRILKKYSFNEGSKTTLHATNRKSTPVVPNLLESLRCHKTDEYPVISAEDETPIPPLACSFSRAKNTAHVLALVDENGSVVVYNTNKAGDESIVTDWIAHSNAIFDVKWMGREEKIVTASGDQTVCLWDVKTRDKLLTFKGHTSSVRSVNFRPDDDAVFASGSRDGHVRIWDVRCNRKESKVSCVSIIRNAHTVPLQPGARRKKSRQGVAQQLDSQQSVTCVVFQDDNLLATGGAVDGCVKLWDLRKLKQDNPSAVYQFPYAGSSKRAHGYSSLAFDSYKSRLFASCTDDVIYCYNFTSYSPQPLCTYRGHRNTSFYVKAVVSPDNDYLLSGSSDENAYIWQVDKPNASPVILKGHRSEISDVAWCHTDLFRMVTTSDDNTMRVWRYDPTVSMRKKLGQSDRMYDITGYAELTHRDIGVSAESSEKPSSQSPKPTMKRSATFPFGTVTELTPKRAKTVAVASPSPSIKQWLKRSNSESPQPSASTSSRPKQLKLGTGPAAVTKAGTEAGASASDTVKCDNNMVRATDTTEAESQVKCISKQDQVNVGRKSCKRKLEINEKEESVKRTKFNAEEKKIGGTDNCENNNTLVSKCTENNKTQAGKSERMCDSADSPNKKTLSPHKKNTSPNKKASSPKKKTTSPDKENSSPNKAYRSPNKLDSAMQDLSSAINASPVKGDIPMREFSSPAAVRVLDLNAKTLLQSPTANLPNLIYDGPNCHYRTTPQKESSKKKGLDWLTQMRRQKLVGSSPKHRGCGTKLLDKLEQEVKRESTTAQENEKPAPSTPKSKSPVRGVRPITSFFRRGACAS